MITSEQMAEPHVTLSSYVLIRPTSTGRRRCVL